MNTVAIIQARMGSTRFPGKVLKPLGIGGDTVLDCVFRAVNAVNNIEKVVVATSTLPADDVIVAHCKNSGIPVYRGSESDVLDRFLGVAIKTNADTILRVTADCPFIDPNVISQVVELQRRLGVHYASNIDPPTWPDGLDIECFTIDALKEAHQEAKRPSDRDCVTRYISRNRTRFSAANLTCPLPGLEKERWVLDTERDYLFCMAIAERVSHWPPSYTDILPILDAEPALRKLNDGAIRNERFYDGISDEDLGPRYYDRSQMDLKRAERVIPLGAQTFSKSKLQFAEGAPLFLSHGDGAYVYDVDGNDYVDLVSALLPNVLGYRDPDVDFAIRQQLDRGISLSLATELEADLAERLKCIIPCAEMARFGKTGSDVCSAAIRIAKAHTRRELIMSHGYHGWHDWAVTHDPMRGNGTTRGTTVNLQYGDYQRIQDGLLTGRFACVILEPESDPDFLEHVRKVCDETGTVLIFDEVITGFRWSGLSAQKCYGVTPDLACFGKAMGNGMPISAIVGRKEFMKLMVPPNNIFYSGTFFGETLSLAAACATIDKLQRENVVNSIAEQAHILAGGILSRLGETGAHQFMSVKYPHPLLRITYSNRKVQDIFTKAMADAGVLIINSHNLTWAHKPAQIRRILKAYDEALGIVACEFSSQGALAPSAKPSSAA